MSKPFVATAIVSLATAREGGGPGLDLDAPVTAWVPELTLADCPHIIDYEPKRRDLYQSATQSGEILTASRSDTRTDKSLTSTDSTETGLAAQVEAPLGDPASGAKGTVGATHKWGSVDQDVQSVATDSSRDRRETIGTTTNLSQMYNLLTAYHAGTNRATVRHQ